MKRPTQRTSLKLLLPMAMAFASTMASAVSNCAGNLTYLGANNDGVFVGLAGVGVHMFCTWKGGLGYKIESDGCKAAYSLLSAAALSSKAVRLHYSDDCKAIPNWGTNKNGYHYELAF